MAVNLVWFKKDLRLHDHRPLTRAAEQGDVVCLYIYEPIIFEHVEYDASRLVFTNQCLKELDDALKERGAHLTLRVGDAVEVLKDIHARVGIATIWSHEETGSGRTYERDLAVAAWAKEQNIPWTEIPQTGVVRRLKSRDGWAGRWNKRMYEPLTDTPATIPVDNDLDLDPGALHHPADLGLPESTKPEALRGGESEALAMLDSFLETRGVNYRKDMSSPVTAWEGCSRLSPYLASGAISMRLVWQRTRARIQEVKELRKAGEDIDSRWASSLSSFDSRLHWHCHFMQKLEDQPSLEFENLAHAYDGIREDFNQEHFEAWKAGKTGFPMVDACMRALHQSGWINFRMRAMLVSFASYHLWIHWRHSGQFLAQHFLDYEPGIHWPQMQMQSGTTGINSVRIYSPTKQVKDHDPEGIFIRRYLPELKDVPKKYIAQPETMPLEVQEDIGCIIGKNYPAPIVHGVKAWKEARSKIWAIKSTQEAKEEAKAIYQKHGSRN